MKNIVFENNLVTHNLKMKKIFGLLPQVAKSNANVLIVGESGTGKEVIAQAIHRMSRRSSKDWISVNCAAIPHDLLESELFGHKKGSFTGALFDQKGLVELADKTTLFLDEIGEIPFSLQAKLLRVIQEKKIRAVGDFCEKISDFRLIAATHRNLRQEVGEGRFREDLFYRLNVVPIEVPTLRERLEDIDAMIDEFANYYSRKYNKNPIRFSNSAMSRMYAHKWPGNIRELSNVIERLTLLCSANHLIQSDDLQFDDFTVDEVNVFQIDTGFAMPTLQEIENKYIDYVMARVRHREEAARVLGISRRTIYRKLKDSEDFHQ